MRSPTEIRHERLLNGERVDERPLPEEQVWEFKKRSESRKERATAREAKAWRLSA